MDFALELHRQATAGGSHVTSTAAQRGEAVTHLMTSLDGMGDR